MEITYKKERKVCCTTKRSDQFIWKFLNKICEKGQRKKERKKERKKRKEKKRKEKKRKEKKESK